MKHQGFTDIKSPDGHVIAQLVGIIDNLGYLYCAEHVHRARGTFTPVYSDCGWLDSCDSCGKPTGSTRP